MRHPPRAIVPTFLLLLLAAAPARPDEATTIDTARQACLDSPGGTTTTGMVRCTENATRAYDDLLNRTYQLALGAMDNKSRELLRASQKQWLEFRGSERAALGGPWRTDRGTIVQIAIAAAELGATRERVMELRLYSSPAD